MKIFLVFLAVISLDVFADDSNQNRKGHMPPGLTDTQAACLKNILGEPGKGERPSREKMDQAFSSCGVEKPKAPPAGSGDNNQNEHKEEAGN